MEMPPGVLDRISAYMGWHVLTAERLSDALDTLEDAKFEEQLMKQSFGRGIVRVQLPTAHSEPLEDGLIRLADTSAPTGVEVRIHQPEHYEFFGNLPHFPIMPYEKLAYVREHTGLLKTPLIYARFREPRVLALESYEHLTPCSPRERH